MSESWKQTKEDYSQWLDEIPEGDKREWYEHRIVDEDGVQLHGWSIFGGTSKYRRLSSPEIAKIEIEKANQNAQREMAFGLLPVYRRGVFHCPKCGHEEYKLRRLEPRDCGHMYNDHEFLIQYCRRCRAHVHVKPLDWENPR